MERRIRDDKSAVTTARVIHIFNGKNLCTWELCNVTQARMCTCRRHIWILRTWRFNKISSTCAMRISNKQRQKRSVLLSRFAIGSEPRPEVQALPPHEEPSWKIVCDGSGGSAEFAGILSDSERDCLVLRHSSVRVPHKDHQPQRRIRKVRKRRIFRGAVVSQEKESIRPRTAEGNLLAQHKTRDNRTWTAESNL